MYVALIIVLAGIIWPLFLDRFVRYPKGTATVARSHLRYIFTPLAGLIVLAAFWLHIPWPVLALVGYFLLTGGIVAISNTKARVLRMIYTAQDIENIRHLFLYPDFYVTHVNPWQALMPVIAFALMAATATIFTPVWTLPITDYAALNWLAGVVIFWASLAVFMRAASVIIHEGNAARLSVARDPNIDAQRFGFYGAILLYNILLKDARHLGALHAPKLSAKVAGAAATTTANPNIRHPHVIAVQAESFFDLRRLDSKIAAAQGRTATWHTLDQLAQQHGLEAANLEVPAWGAYTMQSEMAFLTGIPPESYKTGHINPYRTLAGHKAVRSLVRRYREAGYKTLCLHPSKPGFFRRHRVMPNLGFDAFLSAKDFAGAETFGPYVSDKALFSKIRALIDESTQPLFIFAISIESHGPWEAGRLEGVADEKALTAADISADTGYAVFRKHVDNILAEFADLWTWMHAHERGAVMTLYGDHMPALDEIFSTYDFHDTAVDYILADTRSTDHKPNTTTPPKALRVEDLGKHLMQRAGLDA